MFCTMADANRIRDVIFLYIFFFNFLGLFRNCKSHEPSFPQSPGVGARIVSQEL